MYFTLNNIEESFQFLLPFLLFGDKQWINKYGAQEGSRWQNMRWSMQELERKKKKKASWKFLPAIILLIFLL